MAGFARNKMSVNVGERVKSLSKESEEVHRQNSEGQVVG